MVKNETNVEVIREIGNLAAKQGGKIYTHSGNMHADDVYACAVACLLINPVDPDSVKVCRVNDKELEKLGVNDDTALILDIGKGRFDHHFRDEPEKKQFYTEYFWTDYYEGQDGRVPIEKSAVARLWSYAGPEIIYQVMLGKGFNDPDSVACCKAAKNVERDLITKISDTDTRGQIESPNLIAARISRTNDFTQYTNCTVDTAFKVELKNAMDLLIVYCVTEYFNCLLDKTCKDLEAKALKAGHPFWINLEKDWNGPFISAPKFSSSGTLIKWVVSKSNRTEGEWNVNSADSKKYPLLQEIISSVPGYLKSPIPSLAIFDSVEAAEAAVEKLSENY